MKVILAVLLFFGTVELRLKTIVWNITATPYEKCMADHYNWDRDVCECTEMKGAPNE